MANTPRSKTTKASTTKETPTKTAPDETPEKVEEAEKVEKTTQAEEPMKTEPVEGEKPAQKAASKKQEGNVVKIVRSGFFVGGRGRLVGEKVTVSDEVYKQSEKDQIASYGAVFFEKA